MASTDFTSIPLVDVGPLLHSTDEAAHRAAAE